MYPQIKLTVISSRSRSQNCCSLDAFCFFEPICASLCRKVHSVCENLREISTFTWLEMPAKALDLFLCDFMHFAAALRLAVWITAFKCS